MKTIYLETNHFILRDHVNDDLVTYHELISDPESMYYMPEIKTQTLDESRKSLMMAIVESYNPERTEYFLRIEKKDTKEHIGEIGYSVLAFTPVGKIVQLGYFIRKKYWNQGYTTEAVKEMLRFAFEENDVAVVETGCNSENIGSYHVMEKNHMTREAIHKNAVWHDGALHDRYEYRMLREEWLQQKEK